MLLQVCHSSPIHQHIQADYSHQLGPISLAAQARTSDPNLYGSNCKNLLQGRRRLFPSSEDWNHLETNWKQIRSRSKGQICLVLFVDVQVNQRGQALAHELIKQPFLIFSVYVRDRPVACWLTIYKTKFRCPFSLWYLKYGNKPSRTAIMFQLQLQLPLAELKVKLHLCQKSANLGSPSIHITMHQGLKVRRLSKCSHIVWCPFLPVCRWEDELYLGLHWRDRIGWEDRKGRNTN